MWRFFLFFGVFLIILGVGHGFLYFSLIRFYGITSFRWRVWLGILLGLGALSFLPASYMAHAYENAFTGALYMFSGLWLGLGWHVLMGCIVIWGVIGARVLLHLQRHGMIVTTSIFMCFVLWALYGIWSAYHPVVTHVTVHVDGLPAAWEGKTAVHVSDVHLGYVFGETFLRTLIDRVHAIAPDMIFITGDLFDGMDSQLDHLAQPLRTLQAPDGIYFSTGNHETYTGVDKVYAALAQTLITILDDTRAVVDGVQIVGISYPQRGEQKNITEAISGINGYTVDAPSILLYHNPAEAHAARAAGIDLQLAGHTHSGQVFPFQYLTHMIYGPYYRGATTDDGMTVVTSNGVGTWGPTMRTSGRPEIVVIHFQ